MALFRTKKSMALYWFSYLSIYLFSYSIAHTIQEKIEYECVDMYKQPGLQHPLMKDHQIQMKPSAEFQAMLSMESEETSDLSIHTSKARCPKGQVPIHKPQIDYTDNFFNPKKTITEANLHYAIIRPCANHTKTSWGGAHALFSIYKPQVSKDQFSKAWIWLNHREKDLIGSIQFGWAVHTGLYRDDRPRLTTYWISDKHKKGCYNALCRGGYVQVHRSIYPGMVFDKVSIVGKKQYDFDLLVGQDTRTKSWLLMSKFTLIGYWPHQMYPAEGASEVYFGGYAGGPAGAVSPPMGAGNIPREVGFSERNSCLMKRLKYFQDKRLIDIDSHRFEEYVDSPSCYGVWYRQFEIGNGEMLAFGGPGGECGI